MTHIVASIISDPSSASDGIQWVSSMMSLLIILPLEFYGIIKCLSIMQRPTTSKLCVLSLLLSFLFFLFFLLWSIFGAPSTENNNVVIAVRMLFTCIAFTGVVVGIIGLVDYNRRRANLDQGIVQAVCGIALNLILLLAVFFYQLKGSGDFLAEDKAGSSENTPTTTGQLIEIPEFNFRIRSPGLPWVQMNAKRVNKDASIAMLRSKPQIVFLVIAENLGKVDREALTEIAQGNLKSSAESTEIGPTTESTIKGLTWQKFHSTAKTKSHDLQYAHWIATYDNIGYQLVFSGSIKNKQAVFDAENQLLACFELINSDPNASVSAKDVLSPQFGFEFLAKGSGWRAWPDLNQKIPKAHCGVLHASGDSFAIVPLRLDGMDPSIEELAKVLLNAVDFDYPDKRMLSSTAVEMGGLKGLAITTKTSRKEDQPTYIYQHRVLKSSKFAYLIAGWFDEKKKDEQQRIETLMQQVRFRPDASSNATLTEKERKNQGSFWGALGKNAIAAEHNKSAVEYLKKAFEYAPDPDILNDIANTLDKMEETKEATKILKENQNRFPGHKGLKANLAYHFSRAKQAEKAVSLYKEVFSGDFDDLTYLRDYIEQLIILKRLDDATAALDDAMSKQKSPPAWLRLLKAKILAKSGKLEKAIAVLSKAIKEDGFDFEIADELANNYYLAERYKEAGELFKQIIDKGYDKADAWRMRGCCEMKLKQYLNARKCFREALKRDKKDEEARKYLEQVEKLIDKGE